MAIKLNSYTGFELYVGDKPLKEFASLYGITHCYVKAAYSYVCNFFPLTKCFYFKTMNKWKHIQCIHTYKSYMWNLRIVYISNMSSLNNNTKRIVLVVWKDNQIMHSFQRWDWNVTAEKGNAIFFYLFNVWNFLIA